MLLTIFDYKPIITIWETRMKSVDRLMINIIGIVLKFKSKIALERK